MQFIRNKHNNVVFALHYFDNNGDPVIKQDIVNNGIPFKISRENFLENFVKQ